jgi:site-specific recombinase XerD
MRIVVDGARAEISTTHLIAKDHWNEKMGRMKNSANDSIFINGFIDHARNEVKKHFLVFASEGKRTSSIELKNLYLGIDNAPKQKTIMEAYDYHNIKMRELVKVGKVVAATVKRHEITQNKIRSFMQLQYRVDDKALPEMRLSFISEFEHYLLTVDKIQNNTAHKYIKNLKKIMSMAVGLDWIPSNPFTNFKCSYHAPEREILTIEELNKIQNKDFGIARLNEVRDVFIFCCYTGFAYSDIYQFERNSAMKGLDGNLWLSTHRQKTGIKESVPLLPIPLEILERYQNHEYCNKYNKLLPINSNQRYNSYLKELAALCGIDKNLSSHTARHTFATTITLANGVPIETVSKMLGHTSIKTTQIYAKVVEKKVSDDMLILSQKLGAAMPNNKLKVG